MGYEALLRGWERVGFASIGHLFDQAARDLALYSLDLKLREKAIESFARLPQSGSVKLFYNLDNRLLGMPDVEEGNTQEIVRAHGLPPGAICFEVSERHELGDFDSAKLLLDRYKRQQFRIALDDFGSGFSGLQQLYHCEPDYVKLDRFFMAGIATDTRKRLFMSTIVSMAHLLGIHVVGEGIETAEELRVCRELSIDFVQGFFIQRPTTDLSQLTPAYPRIAEEANRDRREGLTVPIVDVDLVDDLEPVQVEDSMTHVFDRFRDADAAQFLVVVDSGNEPLGIIRERHLKKYVYTPYGWALVTGQRDHTLHDYVSDCPTVEVRSSVEHVMEVFAIAADAAEGVIVTDMGKYAGFVSAARLVRAANERSMALAREQNPLTRLPGNSRINEFLSDALADRAVPVAFVYFDFDDFKPFNDTYGFRRGDRAIQMFGDILREVAAEHGCFVGHVGGDDFFCGCSLLDGGMTAAVDLTRRIQTRFASDVASLYEPADRARGWIVAKDRHGDVERFPLLGVSAGIVYVPRGERTVSIDDVGALISALKRCAKGCEERVAVLQIEPNVPLDELRCLDLRPLDATAPAGSDGEGLARGVLSEVSGL